MPCRSSSLDTRCRARIKSPRASSRARTRSRAASCSTLGTVHLDDLTRLQQLRQMQRVPLVGLDTVTGGSLQLRRRRDQTLDVSNTQEPSQTKPKLDRPHTWPGRDLAATRPSPRSRSDPATSDADGSHRCSRPARTRRPFGRAHPDQYSYARFSLRPPATVALPVRRKRAP
jgi:hypothetical protein